LLRNCVVGVALQHIGIHYAFDLVAQAALRVMLGFHTWPQVLAGLGLGTVTAAAWLFAFCTRVQPSLAANPFNLLYLIVLTGLAVAIFLGKYVFSWIAEALSVHTKENAS
jgi:hypothetical protein